jgi:large subunit ribosomal protein L9
MRVILKERVENLGEVGAEVEVSPGYARNFLLPRGFAEVATPGAKKRLAHLAKKAAEIRAEAEKAARARAATLEGARVILEVRVTKEGTLYGGIGATEIANALAAQGLQVERREIETSGAIRSLGVFEARVNLGAGVRVPISVEVRPLAEA